jgi:hypothetical protein
MGVHRALVDYTRRRIVAGARNPRLGREVRARGERGSPRSNAAWATTGEVMTSHAIA